MKLILALIIGIPKALFLAIGYLARHRALLVVVGVVVVVMVVSGAINGHKKEVAPQEVAPGVKVEQYMLATPSRADADKVVATSSRIYYYKSGLAQDDGQVMLLKDYYTYENGQWVKGNRSLPLDRELVGDLIIYDR